MNSATINTTGLITGATITSTGALSGGTITATGGGLISTTGTMNSATINTTGLITAGSINSGVINTNGNNIIIGSGTLSASTGYVNCAVVNATTGLNFTGGQISAYGAFMYLDGLYANGLSTGVQCENLNCGGLNKCKVKGLICRTGGDIVVEDASLNTTASILSNGAITGTSIIASNGTITGTDLIMTSSIGSSTAQKFILPSNSSTAVNNSVLTINSTTKATTWSVIPTQISSYVDYNIFSGVFISKVSGLPNTDITDIVVNDIGKSGQTFTLPSNTSTASLNSVLTLSNTTIVKATTWVPLSSILNYTNYDNTAKTLISNVSGTPTTITDLIISGNIKSNSYDSSVVDTGIITIGGGVLRTGDINIGTSKNTSSAQLIRIGSNDSNATGQEIRFSRPIQPPSIVQLSDRDMGYTSTNLNATTATYASGTVSLTIPATNFYSNGNYMFKCSLTISSTTTKVLTSIKFGLNKTNAPTGYVSNCFTDISINTGTAAIFTNKTYQLSSFFRYLGTYSFDYIITFTGTGTLNVVSSIDFIRLS